jgi:hypothetical protein
LVTPSTSWATSSPNSSRISSRLALVSSTVEPHPGADLGDAHGVGDELVAGAAQLIGVPVAGEVEGARQRLAIDRRDRDRGAAVGVGYGRRVELLDHGEEIGEKLALL